MAVCPTKNNERFEWFLEKACEIGVDRIVPLIGEHSERKVYKTERARKILVSAAKQSLKAAVPVIDDPVSVKDFLKEERPGIKCIAYCFEDQTDLRQSINEVLASVPTAAASNGDGSPLPEIVVMIGPEGDFSPEEARAAREAGFLPVHFGPSRMRTETAALFAVSAVYQHFLKISEYGQD